MILAEIESPIPCFCLRVDLDYVPWDSLDAEEFGHGEPAVFLRLLELARVHGLQFHFFVSNRVLSAFPAVPEAILNEGHDLDWLCKHPSDLSGQEARQDMALKLFNQIGHQPIGLATESPWPVRKEFEAAFYSGPAADFSESVPKFLCNPVELELASRERGGFAMWCQSTLNQNQDVAENQVVTICVRPQILAKVDAHLSATLGVIQGMVKQGRKLTTLRKLVKSPNG